MTQAEIRQILHELLTQTSIPKLDYHFERHGGEFAVDTKRTYAELFQQHLRRTDLRFFTYLEKGQRMWYAVAEVEGHVVQYNESTGSVVSFFGASDINAFLRSGKDWRIEVRQHSSRWEVTPW